MSDVNFLLIDDDPDDREFFEMALKKVPFSINYATASNGICGLDLLTDQDEKPHYIFLDLNMPMLSGKECLSKIRKLQGYKDVPIIIFSTSSFRGDIEDCKKLGASYFFTKVTSISQLSETITKLVSGVEMPYVLN